MGCFNGCFSNSQNSCHNGCVSDCCSDGCCNAHDMCNFDGDLSKVVSEPIYVQKIYDAVMLNLQGLKTVSGQKFSPCIPNGFRLIGVSGINCSKYFNPGDIRDNANLTLKCNTSISGASFVCDQGSEAKVVGPDGTLSERILYADTSECDEEGKGTPIFGTQKVNISGQVTVTLNLILMDNFGREVTFPVSANITIAPSASPLILTSFFEMCMPSVHIRPSCRDSQSSAMSAAKPAWRQTATAEISRSIPTEKSAQISSSLSALPVKRRSSCRYSSVYCPQAS